MMTSLFVRSSFAVVVVFIITSQLNVIEVSGHGYLIEPPQRSSAWRAGFQTPVNNADNNLNCGGAQRQQANGGKCGVCGDAFNVPSPRPNEIGGQYGRGVIVRNYVAGQTVNMSFVITTAHGGYYEFRLCPFRESPQRPTTQRCLDRFLLTVNNGRQTRYVPPQNNVAKSFFVPVKLPDRVACERCVIQWTWNAGNGDDYVNCADVRISRATG